VPVSGLLFFFISVPPSVACFLAITSTERYAYSSSSTTFGYSPELVHKILNESKIINGKGKDSLQKGLKEIMKWRNAFAHGTLQHDNISGCFIRYYSSGNKVLKLSDDFWESVESTFKECHEILGSAIKKLSEG